MNKCIHKPKINANQIIRFSIHEKRDFICKKCGKSILLARVYRKLSWIKLFERFTLLFIMSMIGIWMSIYKIQWHFIVLSLIAWGAIWTISTSLISLKFGKYKLKSEIDKNEIVDEDKV